MLQKYSRSRGGTAQILPLAGKTYTIAALTVFVDSDGKRPGGGHRKLVPEIDRMVSVPPPNPGILLQQPSRPSLDDSSARVQTDWCIVCHMKQNISDMPHRFGTDGDKMLNNYGTTVPTDCTLTWEKSVGESGE